MANEAINDTLYTESIRSGNEHGTIKDVEAYIESVAANYYKAHNNRWPIAYV
jgi:hypothetical protein